MAEKFKTPKNKLASLHRSRATDAHRKRMNHFIVGYIEAKYSEIYRESVRTYYSVKARHPDVTNLTTTRTYKDLIRQIQKAATTQSEAEQQRVQDEAEQQRVQDEAEQQRVQDEAEQQRVQDEAEQQRVQDEAEQQRVQDEAEQQRVQDEAEQQRVQDEAEQQRVKVEITPFQHDIIARAVRETIDNNVEHLGDEEIVDNIVNDLQKNGVWDMILGPQVEVEPSIETVDEGIILSDENEMNDIVQDFNYDLEVEDINIDTEYDFS